MKSENAIQLLMVLIAIVIIIFAGGVLAMVVTYQQHEKHIAEESTKNDIYAEVVDRHSSAIPVNNTIIYKYSMNVKIGKETKNVIISSTIYNKINKGDDVPVTVYMLNDKITDVTYRSTKLE